jgi:hypothetical protein
MVLGGGLDIFVQKEVLLPTYQRDRTMIMKKNPTISTLHWDVVKNNYQAAMYRYISNIIVPHTKRTANSIWIYAIQRYFTGKISFNDLSSIAVDIYETIHFPLVFDKEFEIIAEQYNIVSNKKDIQYYLETTFADVVQAPYNVDFKKVNSYIRRLEKIEDDNECAEKLLNDFMDNVLTIGELSILAQDVMELNLPKGPLQQYDIIELAAKILPTYYYNKKRAERYYGILKEKLSTAHEKKKGL